MTRFAPLLLLAVTLGSCSLVSDDCLYDRVGCDLPGDWQLVAIDGQAMTGRWEIAEGFVDRSGYGVLPTGNEPFPEMRGSFESTYSLDEDRPQGFDLLLWSMTVPNGTVYLDLIGRIESLDGDEMAYVVTRPDARVIYNGGSSNPLSFPLLAGGTRLTFER